MSLLPQFAGSYAESFTFGFLYGLVFCTASCLPYIASYIAGTGAGFRQSVKVTLIFNSGRVAAYALIGAAIGLLKVIISDQLLSAFQIYSSIAFAIVTVIIGVMILWKSKSNRKSCPTETAAGSASGRHGRGVNFGAFSLGLSRGFVLCPPLVAILIYAVTFATPFDSFALAFLFGLGTALSPIILLGGATGWLLNKAPLLRKWIAIGGACLLILLGVITLINAILVTI